MVSSTTEGYYARETFYNIQWCLCVHHHPGYMLLRGHYDSGGESSHDVVSIEGRVLQTLSVLLPPEMQALEGIFQLFYPSSP